MDRFEQAFGEADGFRMVLFPVEAVLPRPAAEGGLPDTSDEPVDEASEKIREAGRISREELYGDIMETLGINRVFVAMTILSSVVAAVGLLRNDVAVIIGAMVIAPLLGPNVAMSLAAALGDLNLLRKALLTNVIGFSLALMVAVLIGIAFTIDPEVQAIASRTDFQIGDMALALAAGSAGTFAFTRGYSNAVIGVMMAVALMPPLVTFGMLLGDGHLLLAMGALPLLLANVVCINLAGVLTFLAQGVRPRTWWEEERSRRSSLIAMAIWFGLLLILGFILYTTQFPSVKQ
jgi:uncharacterized hydrophobic protein (TIGR00341 family)